MAIEAVTQITSMAVLVRGADVDEDRIISTRFFKWGSIQMSVDNEKFIDSVVRDLPYV